MIYLDVLKDLEYDTCAIKHCLDTKFVMIDQFCNYAKFEHFEDKKYRHINKKYCLQSYLPFPYWIISLF